MSEEGRPKKIWLSLTPELEEQLLPLVKDPFFKIAVEQHKRLAEEIHAHHPLEGMLIWLHLNELISAELVQITTEGRKVALEELAHPAQAATP